MNIKDSRKNLNRIWEIDFLRGVAIILMMLFHLLYDLHDFYGVSIASWNTFWYYEGKTSAVLFMILAGISSTFSKSNSKRGLKVFLIGMVLTIGSYIFFPDEYIRFGILHLLGLSMIIFHFIRVIPILWTSILSVLILVLGSVFDSIYVHTWLLSPLGLTNDQFISMDYYPLFPWFGVFLIGTILGRILYKQKRSLFPRLHTNNFITDSGKHSLLIYLVHQPIFLLLLYLLSLLQ